MGNFYLDCGNISYNCQIDAAGQTAKLLTVTVLCLHKNPRPSEFYIVLKQHSTTRSTNFSPSKVKKHLMIHL